jgi:hypothetical protein
MDSFTFWPANESSEQVELFAKKVMPRVKENTKNSLLLRIIDSPQS